MQITSLSRIRNPTQDNSLPAQAPRYAQLKWAALCQHPTRTTLLQFSLRPKPSPSQPLNKSPYCNKFVSFRTKRLKKIKTEGRQQKEEDFNSSFEAISTELKKLGRVASNSPQGDYCSKNKQVDSAPHLTLSSLSTRKIPLSTMFPGLDSCPEESQSPREKKLFKKLKSKQYVSNFMRVRYQAIPSRSERKAEAGEVPRGKKNDMIQLTPWQKLQEKDFDHQY